MNFIQMGKSRYQIRLCENKECGLRYPLLKDSPFGTTCPRCSSSTRLPDTLILEGEAANQEGPNPVVHLEALMDNVHSAWNVGSMFRTADGAGIIRRLFLCGITPTPESSLIRKTSLGAEKYVSWHHDTNGVRAVIALKKQGKRLWALESDERSESLFDLMNEQICGSIVLVVGNENVGVDRGIIEHCERLISIPMYGAKRSLNVAVAFGIAAFTIANFLNRLDN